MQLRDRSASPGCSVKGGGEVVAWQVRKHVGQAGEGCLEHTEQNGRMIPLLQTQEELRTLSFSSRLVCQNRATRGR